MRMRHLALLSLFLLTACAANEYSSVPDPTGEWVAVNPPGFQPLPPATPLHPAAQHARISHQAAPLRTAQASQPPAAAETTP